VLPQSIQTNVIIVKIILMCNKFYRLFYASFTRYFENEFSDFVCVKITMRVEITLCVYKSHSSVSFSHSCECHIHMHTCQNNSHVCQNHTLCEKSHSACGNRTLRVEINLVRVEITLVRVVITVVKKTK
jgi:hypothetical protein